MSDARVPVPKERFSALDTLALTRELRSGAIGARLDKVFDLPGSGIAIAWRRPGSERKEVRLFPGLYGAVGPSAGARETEPNPLARDLRHWLSGSQVLTVTQPGGERLLELELRRADAPEPLLLAAEFFSPGNLTVARGGRLVVVARPRTWAHRAVRVGADYVRPPSRVDPWSATVSELEAALGASRTDRTSTLAVRLSLGGPLAEEVLVRAGVPGSAPAPKDVSKVAPALHATIESLLAEVGEAPRGFLLRRSGVAVDVEPFRARRWEDDGESEVETRASFSEAAEEYFGPIAFAARKTAPVADPRADLDRQRGRQAEAVATLGQQAEQLVAEAERIFAYYPDVEAFLATSAGEEPSGSGPLRVELAGLPTRVWVDRTPTQSAQTIYEEAKRVQAKLAGAKVALAETTRRLDEVSAAVPAEEKGKDRGSGQSAKRFWFERFRWFLSSEGIIVVGGRDAPSNDLVVRRYLKTNDLYVHADLHGAPSVVVKHPEAGRGAVGESTLREAGQFGVAFSKAWRAGLASNDAFWVTADQVSKTGGSGEFVARGAWVIHGTKNYLRDLPLELALGEVTVQDARRWTAAPPAAVERHGEVRFLLTPGEERERPALERKLAEDLGVGRSLLQGLLPAGGVSARRA